MSRPKNLDNIMIALKAKTMEFEREFDLYRGQCVESIPSVAVIAFIEDLKAIFIGNTKLVAPFYLDAIKQLETDMSFVKSTQFNRLVLDAKLRVGDDDPKSVKRTRQLINERQQGVFRCLMCNEIVDVDSPATIWDSALQGYRHSVDCLERQSVDAPNDSNSTAA